MHLLKDVTHAEYVERYQLLLSFDDGVQKVVDLEDYLDGDIFLPLRNVEFFKNFILNKETGTIEWPNEADFSPDFLYEIGKTAEQPIVPAQHE